METLRRVKIHCSQGTGVWRRRRVLKNVVVVVFAVVVVGLKRRLRMDERLVDVDVDGAAGFGAARSRPGCLAARLRRRPAPGVAVGNVDVGRRNLTRLCRRRRRRRGRWRRCTRTCRRAARWRVRHRRLSWRYWRCVTFSAVMFVRTNFQQGLN